MSSVFSEAEGGIQLIWTAVSVSSIPNMTKPQITSTLDVSFPLMPTGWMSPYPNIVSVTMLK